QSLGYRGVANGFADLLASELLGGEVCPLVGEEVGECVRQRVDAAPSPSFLVHLPALLRRGRERRPYWRQNRDSGVRLLRGSASLAIPPDYLAELCGWQRPILRWHRVVWRSLEDMHPGRMLNDLGERLNRC